jgi:hypothetical protein
MEILTGLGDQVGGVTILGIAGRRLLLDAVAPELRAYALRDAAVLPAAPPRRAGRTAVSGAITYRGPAWVANAWRTVECRRAAEGYTLRITDVAGFWIAADGRFILLTERAEGCPPELLLTAVVTAPIVLALALQGIFCLHVSAVRAQGRLVAFAGESGVGKSTLAHFLDLDSGNGWERIIDDILPVWMDEQGQMMALPHFPQLKVAEEYQPVHLAPAEMPLHALYALEQEGQDGQGVEVQVQSLGRRAATMALIQHTAGTRLFDDKLLGEHLSFCAACTAVIAVSSLRYPRRRASLPLVQAALQQDLGLPV